MDSKHWAEELGKARVAEAEATERRKEAERQWQAALIKEQRVGPFHCEQISESGCPGTLERRGSAFYGDCDWQIYHCLTCGAIIHTPYIGHWWAHEVQATAPAVA